MAIVDPPFEKSKHVDFVDRVYAVPVSDVNLISSLELFQDKAIMLSGMGAARLPENYVPNTPYEKVEWPIGE